MELQLVDGCSSSRAQSERELLTEGFTDKMGDGEESNEMRERICLLFFCVWRHALLGLLSLLPFSTSFILVVASSHRRPSPVGMQSVNGGFQGSQRKILLYFSQSVTA